MKSPNHETPDEASHKAELRQNPRLKDRLAELALVGVLESRKNNPLQTNTENLEQLPQTESARHATEALDRLDEKLLNPEEPYSKEIIIGGGAQIEGQQISIIRTPEGNQVVFKLTPEAYDNFNRNRTLPTQTRKLEYTIRYPSEEDRTVSTTLADSFKAYGIDTAVAQHNQDWRALNGMVKIKLPLQGEAGEPISNRDLGIRLDNTMRLLGIESAFTPPDQLSEDNYKTARHQWHHKNNKNTQTERLVRQEVFPGYSTIVEPGAHQEYEDKYGEIAFTHSISSDAALPNILKHGLMSGHERLLRGLKSSGMSSVHDMATGGADSAFVRAISKQGLNGREGYGGTTIVFKPDIADRTDWYAYRQDQYGTTKPPTFDQARLTPDGLFQELIRSGWGNTFNNEQMFRTGISTEDMAGISVGSVEHKGQLVALLRESGITEVNDIPIEDFVQVATRLTQLIDIAHGRQPREQEPHQPSGDVYGPAINTSNIWV